MTPKLLKHDFNAYTNLETNFWVALLNPTFLLIHQRNWHRYNLSKHQISVNPWSYWLLYWVCYWVHVYTLFDVIMVTIVTSSDGSLFPLFIHYNPFKIWKTKLIHWHIFKWFVHILFIITKLKLMSTPFMM